jgi:hypothetical protein
VTDIKWLDSHPMRQPDFDAWQAAQRDDLFYDADIAATRWIEKVTPGQARADLISGLSPAELTILQHTTDRRLQ